MAEALGIAGSAVGIVSLGLQLYGGIATYFDALEGREDDLASARAQLDSLRDSLVTIQSALPPLASASATATATAGTGSGTVPPIVRECEKELSQLDSLLQELAGSSTSSKKLKEKMKTLRFPFRRDNLMKLEDRLHKTNSVFQTALSVFHLNKSLGNEQKLADVEAATTQIPAINTTVVKTNTDVQEIKAGVGQISNDMNTAMSTLHSSNNAVDNLANGFATFAPAANSQLGEIRLSMSALAQGDDIRQLTSIAVNNANMLATLERRMQTLSVLEERLGMLADSDRSLDTDSIQAQDPRFALQRLLAKPSQTREIFDSVAPFRSTTRHNGSSFQEANELSLSSKFQGPSCTCQLRKSRQRTSRNFGPFWLRTETSYHGHSQTCQLSKWNLGRNRRWIELTTARRSSFWSWAVGVSFVISTGAGGLSISPNISYRPLVDEKKSPVFRILNLLEDFLLESPAEQLNQGEISRCLSAAASAILTLYQEKKAFPYEVNTRGKSAVYKMVVMLCYRHSWRKPLYDFVIWAVEEAGLPANICDFGGRTPATELAARLAIDNDRVQPLLSILYDKAPESVLHYDMLKDWFDHRDGFWAVRHVPPGSGSGQIEFESRSFVHDVGKETGTRQRLTSLVFGYGPLSTAIAVQHGAEQINDLINATNICEVNSFGQTPLHVAAVTGNLDVLATLLRSPHIIDILHLRDFQEHHAIDYAVAYSGWHCLEPRSHVPCSNCCCTDRLGMLLCVEGCFDGYLENISDAPTFVRVLSYGPLRSTFLLLSKLKVKRDQIKHMALKHLGNEDIQRYKLDRDDVLDYHGIDVVERLNDIGIKVPATLQNSFLKSDRRCSIYHNLPPYWGGRQLEQVAQLMFDLGFHDIDGPDELGRTPLMLVPKSNTRLAVIHWFLGHGADFTLRLPRTASNIYPLAHVNPTIAQHMIPRFLGIEPSNRYLDPQLTTLIARAVPVDTADDCNCSCTEDGCGSASILFWELWSKGYKGGDEYAARRPKAATETGSEIAWVLERNSLDFTYHRHVCLAALRMLTFAALGIRHTCGCPYVWYNPRLSSDEIEAIWEEDAHLIKLLEEIQAEFAAKLDASDMKLSAFLATEWGPRMEIILGELDGYKLSEAERTGAEDIGVEWQTQEEVVEEVEEVEEVEVWSHILEDPDRISVEEFFRRLREIENE